MKIKNEKKIEMLINHLPYYIQVTHINFQSENQNEPFQTEHQA